MKLVLAATCLFGLEHLLGEEIDALGYNRIETIDGRVYYEGDEEAVALSNIFLRYAERVYIVLGRFPARTFDELFENTRALPFEAWLARDDAFPVKGHAIKSALFSVPDCQKIVKRAIVARLSEKYGLTWFPESERQYQIEFFIFRDQAALMIDTSGAPLHKRGYRPESNTAPIRETLAAALATMARPRGEVLFWDPFCGSGTIAIEAAMLYNKVAPGAFRHFAAENYPQIPLSLWCSAREEAREGRIQSDFTVFASDIEPECVALTARNAERAGVLSTVRAFQADARTIRAEGRRGTIVTNPPYGERMLEKQEVEKLYREIGRHFATLAPWQIYIISSHEGFERLYGRRADKVRKLYNGMIPCYYYQFFKNQRSSQAPFQRNGNRSDAGKVF